MIIEDLDRGVPIYRRVLVGYVPRGPGGLPMCTVCGVREVYRRSSRYCGSECRMSARRRKARWMPCPVCLRACIKCSRAPECRAVWTWRGRTPVHRDTRQPLHLRVEGAL